MGCSDPVVGPVTCTGGRIQNASATTTTYTSGFPNTNRSDNGAAKIDYNISNKNRINGMVFISNSLADGEDHPIVAKYWQNSNPLKAYSVVGSWVYVPSSSVVNEFRFGYNKFNFALVSAAAASSPMARTIPSTRASPVWVGSPMPKSRVLLPWAAALRDCAFNRCKDCPSTSEPM